MGLENRQVEKKTTISWMRGSFCLKACLKMKGMFFRKP